MGSENCAYTHGVLNGQHLTDVRIRIVRVTEDKRIVAAGLDTSRLLADSKLGVQTEVTVLCGLRFFVNETNHCRDSRQCSTYSQRSGNCPWSRCWWPDLCAQRLSDRLSRRAARNTAGRIRGHTCGCQAFRRAATGAPASCEADRQERDWFRSRLLCRLRSRHICSGRRSSQTEAYIR